MSCTITRSNDPKGFWVISERLTPLLGRDQTDCKFDFVAVHATPNGGPPPHRHRGEHEIFYVVDGTYAFIKGDESFTAGPGEAVFLPRGSLHTYNNIGSSPGELLVTAAPSNFARFVEAAGFEQRREIGPEVFE